MQNDLKAALRYYVITVLRVYMHAGAMYVVARVCEPQTAVNGKSRMEQRLNYLRQDIVARTINSVFSRGIFARKFLRIRIQNYNRIWIVER